MRFQSADLFEDSKRTGTPAAAMEEQVEVEAVKGVLRGFRILWLSTLTISLEVRLDRL